MKFAKEELAEELYINQQLTTREIAAIKKTSQGSVNYWLAKHEIPARHGVGGANY